MAKVARAGALFERARHDSRVSATHSPRFVATVVLRRSLPVVGLAAVTVVVALVKEVVIAGQFGTGREVDAYLVAALYPTLLSSVFTSTVAGCVVPVFHTATLEGEAALVRYIAALWTASLIVLIGGAIIILILLYPLLSLSAPGFEAETRVLSFRLAAVMLPSGVMAGLAGCVGAVLNARKVFVVPGLVTVLGTGAIAVSTLLFGKQLGVFSIALGSVIGSGIGLMLVWVYAVTHGTRLRLGPVLRNPHLRLTTRLSAPLLLGVVTTFATLFVDRAMASSLPGGSVAALGYADKIVRLPEAILMLTVPAVMFPYLAESSASGDLRRVNQLSNLGATLMILLLVPVALVFFFLATPIVVVIFARGEFDSQAVNATAAALVGYAFGVVFSGLGYVFPRVLLALHRSAAIGLLGCLNVVLKLVLNTLLVPILEHQGIALASTLTYLVTDVAFVVVLWRAGIRLTPGLVLTALAAGTFIGLAAVGAAQAVSLLSWTGIPQLAMGGLVGATALVFLYRAGALTRILGEGEGSGTFGV